MHGKDDQNYEFNRTMPNMGNAFSIRAFLRQREALLIHFSGEAGSLHGLHFPDDLRAARSLRDIALSFSTIGVGDVGPYQTDIHPEHANAQGSIGIVVDIPNDDSVVTVTAYPHGERLDFKNKRVEMLRHSPNSFQCARSIDARETSNEWCVKNYEVVGIFLFEPAFAVRTLVDVMCEIPIGLEDVLKYFPEDRIFSIRSGQFVEYDRVFSTWAVTNYSSILPDSGAPRSTAKQPGYREAGNQA